VAKTEREAEKLVETCGNPVPRKGKAALEAAFLEAAVA
jgi:hypothetical protein